MPCVDEVVEESAGKASCPAPTPFRPSFPEEIKNRGIEHVPLPPGGGGGGGGGVHTQGGTSTTQLQKHKPKRMLAASVEKKKKIMRASSSFICTHMYMLVIRIAATNCMRAMGEFGRSLELICCSLS